MKRIASIKIDQANDSTVINVEAIANLLSPPMVVMQHGDRDVVLAPVEAERLGRALIRLARQARAQGARR